MNTESTFEWVIFKIDQNQKTIEEFDNEHLPILLLFSIFISLL